MQTSVISAYIWGGGVLIVTLLLAAIVSLSIKYEPGTNPRDPQKRRAVFWVFFVACLVLAFLMPYVFVYGGIKVPTQKDTYLLHTTISAGVMALLYVFVGWIISRASGHGKLSNWF